MNSLPESAQVLDDLGDKVVEAISRSVSRSRGDLADYRTWRPDFVAQQSKRGLANWLHDRLWFHLTVLLEGVPNVFLVDDGPTREVTVGLSYRMRVKRHQPDGAVSTYPTQTALEFLDQPNQQLVLASMEEHHLIAGYEWLNDSYEIGVPVLTMRDGRDNILWQIELPEFGDEATASPIQRPATGPPKLIIEVSDAIAAGNEDEGSHGE